jgi:hypothetical protein
MPEEREFDGSWLFHPISLRELDADTTETFPGFLDRNSTLADITAGWFTKSTVLRCAGIPFAFAYAW